jgi:hypothetical protein
VPSGRGRLVARDPASDLLGARVVEVPAGAGLAVSLHQGAWLRGRLVDAVGPLKDVGVALTTLDWSAPPAVVQTGDDGSFAIGPLHDARYTLALAPGEPERLVAERGLAVTLDPSEVVVAGGRDIDRILRAVD